MRLACCRRQRMVPRDAAGEHCSFVVQVGVEVSVRKVGLGSLECGVGEFDTAGLDQGRGCTTEAWYSVGYG